MMVLVLIGGEIPIPFHLRLARLSKKKKTQFCTDIKTVLFCKSYLLIEDLHLVF